MSSTSPSQTPTRKCPTIKFKFGIKDILRSRELGLKKLLGYEDDINLWFYNRYERIGRLEKKPCSNDTQKKKLPEELRKYGGIFNLEFSLDGHLLAAACEEKCILIHDASNRKLIKTIPNAHMNCVNCIRFLNSRVFATCSDDTSIKLWDIRNLKSEQKTLFGHSNWVKNIEFSEAENMMVTSAFDGTIYAWNIDGLEESNRPFDKVFLMNGLMRTKLSPDGSKMIISTTSGFMIIIHDLNLTMLSKDLSNFKPNLYRLMQISEQNFPAGNIFNYLFHPSRRRNRVEFVDDFPNKAEVISSLQIHPHGWNALSRNIDADDNDDWTSVHDIQMHDKSEYVDSIHVVEEDSNSDNEQHNSRTPNDLWMGNIKHYHYGFQRASSLINQHTPLSTMNSGLIGKNSYKQYPVLKDQIVGNIPRLTHFIKEKNAGKGYIKEVCFSPDGRVICSPYDKGIRLLGFNDECQELSYCVPKEPRELNTLVEMNNYHGGVVVSCKFSPVHKQLVSGCLNGDIVWYEPLL